MTLRHRSGPRPHVTGVAVTRDERWHRRGRILRDWSCRHQLADDSSGIDAKDILAESRCR